MSKRLISVASIVGFAGLLEVLKWLLEVLKWLVGKFVTAAPALGAVSLGIMFIIDCFFWWPAVAKGKRLPEMPLPYLILPMIAFAFTVFMIVSGIEADAFLYGYIEQIRMLPWHKATLAILEQIRILPWHEATLAILRPFISVLVIFYGGLYPLFIMFLMNPKIGKPVEASPFWDQGAFKWITLSAEGLGCVLYLILWIQLARPEQPAPKEQPMQQIESQPPKFVLGAR